MATRAEIAADMRRTFGSNALTKQQVGQYMGYKPRATYNFLRGVDAISSPQGRQKKYLVIDLAKKLYRDQVPGDAY